MSFFDDYNNFVPSPTSDITISNLIKYQNDTHKEINTLKSVVNNYGYTFDARLSGILEELQRSQTSQTNNSQIYEQQLENHDRKINALTDSISNLSFYTEYSINTYNNIIDRVNSLENNVSTISSGVNTSLTQTEDQLKRTITNWFQDGSVAYDNKILRQDQQINQLKNLIEDIGFHTEYSINQHNALDASISNLTSQIEDVNINLINTINTQEADYQARYLTLSNRITTLETIPDYLFNSLNLFKQSTEKTINNLNDSVSQLENKVNQALVDQQQLHFIQKEMEATTRTFVSSSTAFNNKNAELAESIAALSNKMNEQYNILYATFLPYKDMAINLSNQMTAISNKVSKNQQQTQIAEIIDQEHTLQTQIDDVKETVNYLFTRVPFGEEQIARTYTAVTQLKNLNLDERTELLERENRIIKNSILDLQESNKDIVNQLAIQDYTRSRLEQIPSLQIHLTTLTNYVNEKIPTALTQVLQISKQYDDFVGNLHILDSKYETILRLQNAINEQYSNTHREFVDIKTTLDECAKRVEYDNLNERVTSLSLISYKMPQVLTDINHLTHTTSDLRVRVDNMVSLVQQVPNKLGYISHQYESVQKQLNSIEEQLHEKEINDINLAQQQNALHNTVTNLTLLTNNLPRLFANVNAISTQITDVAAELPQLEGQLNAQTTHLQTRQQTLERTLQININMLSNLQSAFNALLEELKTNEIVSAEAVETIKEILSEEGEING